MGRAKGGIGKKLVIAAIAVLLMLGAATLYVLNQHSFDITEQKVLIETPQGKLTGVLALPKSYEGKLGLVLFIHGDGAIDATHQDGYKPLWERLARQGYASLSLNKRGINGSEGNWLDQSLQDRVVEAQQAIAWAKEQSMIDSQRVGVWGASQAGWVIPALAGKEKLAFSILVSPAINWLTQGEYHTRRMMAKQGYSADEIEEQVAYEQSVIPLLRKGASYAEYEAISSSESRMSQERWAFVSKNFLADAGEDLASFDSPVLLFLGEDDIHVDVKETEREYRKKVKSQLLQVVVLQDTEHSMLRTATADSELRALAISLFAPRQITTKEYMDEIEAFLDRLPQ